MKITVGHIRISPETNLALELLYRKSSTVTVGRIYCKASLALSHAEKRFIWHPQELF
jgi:hypothetical protein